jgi:uncharacterized protein with NRDE domain
MCLAALLIGRSERFPFLLASNRDEFFSRASQALQWWQPQASAGPILSGKDISGGGTWMGLNASGRLALVTNVREPGRHLAASPSRGELVLQSLADPQADLQAGLIELAHVPRNGFNLLRVDLGIDPAQPPGKCIGGWVSNRPRVQHQWLGAGAFGLSNAALDTPWPKVRRLKQRLAQALEEFHEVDTLLGEVFAALADPLPAADADLPSTGLTMQRERQLSSAFIHIAADDGRAYGTRCSTVVIVEALAGRRTAHVVERTHDELGRRLDRHDQRFALPLPPSR